MITENKLISVDHLVHLIDALFDASYTKMRFGAKQRVNASRKVNLIFSQIDIDLNRMTESNTISVPTGYQLSGATEIIADNKSIYTIADEHKIAINALKPYIVKYTKIFAPNIDNYRLDVKEAD